MDLFFPQTIEEAVGLLVQHEGARCISGGATLVAMMNAGLVEPTGLISLRQIPGLAGLARDADGTVRIGAMTRHVDTATSGLFIDGQRVVPLAAIRNQRSVLYVGNLVEAIDAALDTTPPPMGVHFVADGESVSTPGLVTAAGIALDTPARLVAVPVALLQFLGSLSGKTAKVQRLVDTLEVDASSFSAASARRSRRSRSKTRNSGAICT